MTSSQMGERITFSRYRILVSNDPRWIHRKIVAKEATCHSSIGYIEYERKRDKMLYFIGSDCRRS